MKNILFALAVFAVVSFHAQNRLPIMQTGDTLSGVTLNPSYVEDHYDYEYNEIGKYDYHIPQPPKVLTASIRYNVRYVTLANQAVNDFQQSSQSTYGIYDYRALWLNAHKRVAWNTAEGKDVRWEKIHNESESLKKLLLSSRILREAIYSWLMPVYKTAFSLMSVPEQETYLAHFRDAVSYVENFNLEEQREKADDGFVNEVGHLNAFIYRRIANEELSREECLEWLNRIIKDFESVRRANPTELDNYIISSHVKYNYYSGWIFREKEYYSPVDSYFRKENNTFIKLPGVEFDWDIHYGDNYMIGRVPENANGWKWGIFYYDSTRYTFSTTTYSGDVYESQLIGTENNPRLIVKDHNIVTEDENYNYVDTKALCVIIDVDSGTVIAKDLIIATKYVDDPETGYYGFLLPENIKEYFIYQDDRTGMWGARDGSGNEILPAQYKSIEATATPGVFKVNGRKKINTNKKKR